MNNISLRIFPLLAALLSVWLTGCGNPAAANVPAANVRHLTAGEFDTEVTHGTNAVVADFYATWCGPCRRLSPMLAGLAAGYTNKINFVKIDVDESPTLAKDFQVSSIPSLIFIRNGKESSRLTGLPEEAELKAALEKFAAEQ